MRTLVQISDLHFGTILEPTIEPLVRLINELRPDLVIDSGDLTQRARRVQFSAAVALHARLPQPLICLPGNHDVPAYNLWRRFAEPLDRYKKMVTRNLCPTYIDDQVAVIALNTARAFVIKGGRLNREQVEWAAEQFERLAGNQVRIIVTHHPFDIPTRLQGVDIVGRAQMAMERFAQCKVDLFLGGHLHLVHVGSTARYKIPGYVVPILQAGTATSTRARGEPNSFFVHRVEPGLMETDTYMWKAEAGNFERSDTVRFVRTEVGWVPQLTT
jgi:3',5'-cyclic AMP phosphodiesterase CpdA